MPLPLPADRPVRAQIAEVHDAAQEFLTDWLVRRNLDEALEFVSDRSLACVDTDDDPEDEVLSASAARRLLRDLMDATNDEMGDRDNLTEAIDAVLPWDTAGGIVDHPFDGDFTMLEMADEDAEPYLCGPGVGGPGAPVREGGYYGSLFRLRIAGDAGGVLGLLWQREDSNWRIVAYEVFEQ